VGGGVLGCLTQCQTTDKALETVAQGRLLSVSTGELGLAEMIMEGAARLGRPGYGVYHV